MSKVSQDRNGKNYQERLASHLDDRPYRAETVVEINRIVHVGSVSAQSALEIIEALEDDHLRTDCEMQGMEAFDRVFYPGEIGGATANPSQLDLDI